MKGQEKLWSILNDKLDTLRATNRLPQAIRVAETALEVAKRAFPDGQAPLATSFENLGELLDQKGDRTAAKAYLLKAYAILEKLKPPDQRATFHSARRLGFLCDNIGQPEDAIRFYEKAIAAGTQLEDVPYSDLGTMLNNVAIILRKSGRQKAAEPYYLRALQIYEKQLGPDHADVASVLNNLAVFYTNERRYTEAEEIHLRALAIREKLHPPPLPTSRSQNAILPSSIIPAAITPKRRSFIRIRSRFGRSQVTSLRRITRLSYRIMRIFCAHLARYVKLTNWRFAHGRNVRQLTSESSCLRKSPV